MVTMGLELTGEIPFKVIYLHGLVRDAQGQKMSKTKGNVIDPLDTIDQFGSDALRYSLVTGSTPGQDIPLSIERIEGNRNFVNKLWNAGKYITNCVAVWQKEVGTLPTEAFLFSSPIKEEMMRLPLPERYIISRCHELIDKVSKSLEEYNFGESGRLIYEFLWDELADWFIEVSKTHVKNERNDRELQQQSIRTLIYVWDMSLRLLHPFMPYITETLWQLIPHTGDTIMLAPWPLHQSQELYVDEESIAMFGKLQSLVRSIRNARAEYNVDVSKKIEVIVRASPKVLAALQEEKKAFIMLGRVDEAKLSFVAKEEGTAQKLDVDAVHLIIDEELEAYLPQSGLLDREKEVSRLGKQAEKLKKDIAVLEGRLGNKSFVDKAPESLVQEVQGKLSDMRQQLSAVDTSLQKLLSSV